MNPAELSKLSFWLLFFVSLLLLLTVPEAWIYQPDSGIYIGTTVNVLGSGEYSFNGHPNLQYYPGMVALLSLPIAIFGVDFYALNVVSTLVVIAILFATRRLFQRPDFGPAVLLVPLLMLFFYDLQVQRITVLSDAPFLLFSLLALLGWNRYQKSRDIRYLAITTLLVAMAALFRFQGLVLIGAFAIALLIDLLPRKPRRISIAQTVLFSGLAAAPFVLWTLRNVLLYSPDTHNMVLKFFFGMEGLPLRAPGSFQVDWIDARWKYGVYNLLFSTDAFIKFLIPDYLVSFIPLEGRFLVFWGLVALGAHKWYPGASVLERSWVFFILAFYAFWMLRSSGLYFTTRQMLLPALPFLILFLTLGVTTLIGWLRSQLSRRIAISLSIIMLAFIAHAGIQRMESDLYDAKHKYLPANKALHEMRQYISEQIAEDGRLATTDWGILPFYAERESYPVLNDPSHEHTLKRIANYRTGHLVILTPSSWVVDYAKNMVSDHPEIFTHVKHFGTDTEKGPRVDIYSINLEKVDALGLE